MSVFEMRLCPEPFEMIKSGKKTIELRLNDEKRRPIRNGDRISVSVVNTRTKPAVPSVPDRHVVDWTCPWKVYVGGALQRDVRLARPKEGERRLAPQDAGANLLADRPSTRSAWQRCPSWLVKFDATTMDGGQRIYRLTQCEKGAGMQNIVTDAFLRHGNGSYRLSLEARAKCGAQVPLEVCFLSNEKRATEKFSVPGDGQWRRCDVEVVLDFDLSVTELLAVFFRAGAPCDELSFRGISLVKTRRT